ncbi:MAG: ATP-binding protein [Candidatus Methylomirabilales bacterium]
MKRVLVVDNDRLCADLLADALANAGYLVDKASDGVEAVERLRAARPDVVILDIVMPRLSGERVFAFLKSRAETKDVPVIILSGTLVEDRQKLLGLRADAYVAKAHHTAVRQNVLAALRHIERHELPPAPVLGVDGLLPRAKVRELVELREYVQALLDAVGEGVVEVDARWRVVCANRAAVQILGRAESALLGEPSALLFGEDQAPALRAAVERFLASGEPPAPLELKFRGRVVTMTFAPVRTPLTGGAYFLVLQDVTDLAAKIEDLSTLNRRLQDMDRMRSELLTMVSHDLHTPLTAIKGSLDVLLHESVGVELTQELLGIAQKNADRLFRMVSDILDLARIEAGRFKQRREDFDLTTCLRGTLDRLGRLAQDKAIGLSLEVPDGLAPIWADGVRMEQVFTNLLGNALKFTPRGGRIGVTVEDAGRELLVRVWDTGVGIPAEHLDRIFDRFYRVPLPADAQVEGTGLGLTICKAVVEEHGGRIWVESAAGKGATFFLTLPKGEEGRRAGAGGPAPPAA